MTGLQGLELLAETIPLQKASQNQQLIPPPYLNDSFISSNYCIIPCGDINDDGCYVVHGLCGS